MGKHHSQRKVFLFLLTAIVLLCFLSGSLLLSAHNRTASATDNTIDEIGGLGPGESRQESFSEPCPCSLPTVGIEVETDVNGSIIDMWETDSSQVRETIYGAVGTCDLSIAEIWLKDRSTVCYEIMNQGTLESGATRTKIEIYLGRCGGYETIYQREPSLGSGSSRTVCLNISLFLRIGAPAKR